MKILSIRQPWAWLIMCLKVKDIETRTWRPSNDLIGKQIGIHVGLKMETSHYQIQALRYPDMPSSLGLPRGVLLGTAILKDVIEYKSKEQFYNDTDRHLCYKGMFDPVRYGLVLEHPLLLPRPLPMKGALGFFDYDE